MGTSVSLELLRSLLSTTSMELPTAVWRMRQVVESEIMSVASEKSQILARIAAGRDRKAALIGRYAVLTSTIHFVQGKQGSKKD